MRSIALLATVLAAAACRHPAPVPEPQSAPEPRAAPAPERRGPPIASPPKRMDIGVCILRDGQAVRVDALYDVATGDTTIGGKPVPEVHPATSPPYAEGVDWYVRGDPIPSGGRMMFRYGLPRILLPEDVRPVGQYRGLALFAEAGDDSASPSVLYLFVRPSCQFQPYQVDYVAGAVRGG